MKYLKYWLFLLTFIFTGVYSLSYGQRPFWANEDYHRVLRNSYLRTIRVTGPTHDIRKEKADAEIIKDRKLAVGDTDAQVKIKIVASFIEDIAEYFLYQTRTNLNEPFDNVEITNEYGMDEIGFRAVVPGMAQIYKGSNLKGAFFIVGEAALIGGVVFAENQRATEISLFNTTHDKQLHSDNAKMYETTRNLLIGGAILFWGWNIIDGLVANGEEHLRIHKFDRYSSNLKIRPYYAPDTGAGVALTLKF